MGTSGTKAVTNCYVRGFLEYTAAALLPATPPTHVELLERKLRAATRVVTGCTRSTQTLALMTEAGVIPMAARRTILAAPFLSKARVAQKKTFSDGWPTRRSGVTSPRFGDGGRSGRRPAEKLESRRQLSRSLRCGSLRGSRRPQSPSAWIWGTVCLPGRPLNVADSWQPSTSAVQS